MEDNSKKPSWNHIQETPPENSSYDISNTSTADSSSTKTNKASDLIQEAARLREALYRERQEKEIVIASHEEIKKQLDLVRAQLHDQENVIVKLRDEVGDLRFRLEFAQKDHDMSHSMSPMSSPRSAEFKIMDIMKNPVAPQACTPLAPRKIKMFTSLNCTYMFVYIPLSPPICIRRYLHGVDFKVHEELKQKFEISNKKIELLQEKLNEAIEALDHMNKEALDQVEAAEMRHRELESELEGVQAELKEVNMKNEDLNHIVARLRRDKEVSDSDISRMKVEMSSLKAERDKFDRNYHEKVKMIQELNLICQTMEEKLNTSLAQVDKLSKELQESELKMQVFEAIKSDKSGNTPALILMRKNVNDEHFIEIESAGERVVVYPHVIQSFGPIKEVENSFYFDFKDDKGVVQRDVFQVSDRKKVLKNFMGIIRLAEKNKANARRNKVRSIIREKNSLSLSKGPLDLEKELL